MINGMYANGNDYQRRDAVVTPLSPPTTCIVIKYDYSIFCVYFIKCLFDGWLTWRT